MIRANLATGGNLEDILTNGLVLDDSTGIIGAGNASASLPNAKKGDLIILASSYQTTLAQSHTNAIPVTQFNQGNSSYIFLLLATDDSVVVNVTSNAASISAVAVSQA